MGMTGTEGGFSEGGHLSRSWREEGRSEQQALGCEGGHGLLSLRNGGTACEWKNQDSCPGHQAGQSGVREGRVVGGEVWEGPGRLRELMSHRGDLDGTWGNSVVLSWRVLGPGMRFRRITLVVGQKSDPLGGGDKSRSRKTVRKLLQLVR